MMTKQPGVGAGARRLQRLIQKFNGRCYYCTNEIEYVSIGNGQDRPPNMAIREHHRPRRQGGYVEGLSHGDEAFNIVASCFQCDFIKGDTDPDVFTSFVRAFIVEHGSAAWHALSRSDIRRCRKALLLLESNERIVLEVEQQCRRVCRDGWPPKVGRF